MSTPFIIPRHEPEVIAMKARKHVGEDKVATTSLNNIIVDGVELVSRYQKAHELALMRSVVLLLPRHLRAKIAEFFCDSKACWSFTLRMRTWDVTMATEIASLVDRAMFTLNGGHNSVWVTDRDNTRFVEVAARWRGDEIGECTP